MAHAIKRLTDYQRDIITGWADEAKCLRADRERSIRNTLSMVDGYAEAEADVRRIYDKRWPISEKGEG